MESFDLYAMIDADIQICNMDIDPSVQDISLPEIQLHDDIKPCKPFESMDVIDDRYYPVTPSLLLPDKPVKYRIANRNREILNPIADTGGQNSDTSQVNCIATKNEQSEDYDMLNENQMVDTICKFTSDTLYKEVEVKTSEPDKDIPLSATIDSNNYTEKIIDPNILLSSTITSNNSDTDVSNPNMLLPSTIKSDNSDTDIVNMSILRRKMTAILNLRSNGNRTKTVNNSGYKISKYSARRSLLSPSLKRAEVEYKAFCARALISSTPESKSKIAQKEKNSVRGHLVLTTKRNEVDWNVYADLGVRLLDTTQEEDDKNIREKAVRAERKMTYPQKLEFIAERL